MMNYKKVLFGFAALSAVLSGCGRNDYNGTYEGYETAQASNTTGQAYGIMVQPEYATLTLSQNGETVSGNYSTKTGVQGSFMANASSSNQLSNVRLTLTQTQQNGNYNGFNNYGYNQGSYCPGQYQGNLTANDNARRLQGTLTLVGGGTAMGYGNTAYNSGLCSGKTLDLSKTNSR